MKKLLFFIIPVLASCIGEDIVEDGQDPEVRITNPIDSIQKGNTHTFITTFLDNVGKDQTPDSIQWRSSNKTIATIDQKGVLNALTVGKVTITVTAFLNDLKATAIDTINIVSVPVMIRPNTNMRSGTLTSSGSYTLRGSFTITVSGNNLLINFSSDFVADTSLPRLVLYLTNNSNSPAGGKLFGNVVTFSGAHAIVVENVGLLDYNYLFYYCAPFRVKVGHGKIN